MGQVRKVDKKPLVVIKKQTPPWVKTILADSEVSKEEYNKRVINRFIAIAKGK